MSRLIVETAAKRDPPVADLHPGDLTWQRFMLEDHLGRWSERVRVWENRGGLLSGFAIYYDRSFELLPVLRGGIEDVSGLLNDMAEWGFQQAHAAGKEDQFRLVTVPDGPLENWLSANGFTRADEPEMKLTARLLDSIEAVDIPDGFAVRSLTGPHEFDERVAIHREAFAPSRLTVEAYRRLRTAPGYDPELDLVCVAPDGTFTSYCVAWYDPETRTGEFEPVGARAAWRRMGLTKAVMTEGMRRLKDRGATMAMVSCYTANPAACGLYESLGFREVNRSVPYKRKDSAGG